jgi:hypothetical protein
VFRNELPRVYELIDLTNNLHEPCAYFHNFESSYRSETSKREAWQNREKQLQALDLNSWKDLKHKASSYLMKPDYAKGGWWHQLIETLNEARGYNYLKDIGCSSIKFIPSAIINGVEAPDLKGELNNFSVLCEVKTINISDEEAYARRFGACRTITDQLGDGFFNKLMSDLLKAQRQMKAYDDGENIRRIAYVIIDFDDALGEYKEDYFHEIDRFLADKIPAGVEVVFHNQRTCFHKAITLTAATIVNE